MTKKNIFTSIALLLLAAFIAAVALTDGRSDDERRAACARALMTGANSSTTGYQDKQAYDAHVAKECEGFDLSKM